MTNAYVFPDLVTIQAATETQSPSGEVALAFADAYADVPAAVTSAVAEGRGPTMTLVTDEVNVLLRGDYSAVGPDARLLIGGNAYDVMASSTNPRGTATWLRAKRISPDGDDR